MNKLSKITVAWGDLSDGVRKGVMVK